MGIRRRQQGKWGLIAWLVVSSAATTAKCTSFEECYFTCFAICAITPGVAFSDCPLRCLQACILPSFPIDKLTYNNNSTNNNNNNVSRKQRNHFFCHLGCAASSCANFSTHQNIAERKVGRCVDSCSQTCSMI